MLRLLILTLCIQSLRFADISSPNFFFSGVLPFINFCFLVYIVMSPLLFLYSKGLMAQYGRTADEEKFGFLLRAFFNDIMHKYDDTFSFMGSFAHACRLLTFVVELALVVYTVFIYFVLVVEGIA